MNSRYLWVSIAAAALLTAASACLAQEATPPAPATPPAARPPVMGAVPGTGSIGGMTGGSLFYAAEDYSKGAQPRMAFSAAFRYTMRPWLRWQVSPGFAWAAYTNREKPPFKEPNHLADLDKGKYLTLLLPMSAEMQLLARRGAWLYHIGAGPGLYRVWVEDARWVVKDPVSLKLHRGLYPGATIEIGAERFLKALPAVSVEGAATSHYVAAQDDASFPSGFNSTLGVFELRVGANYHFNLLNQAKKTAADPSAVPPPAH